MLILHTIYLSVALLTSFANADCGTLADITNIGRHKATEAASKYTGVNLISQLQQVSQAVTCRHNSAHQAHGAAALTCPPPHCSVASHGHAYSKAMTNLSYATVDDQQANQRIAQLAADQAHLRGKDVGFDKTYRFGQVTGYSACYNIGQSFLINFQPMFACVTGILRDCGDGTGLEKDGTGVTVCLPAGPRGASHSAPDGTLIVTKVSEEYANKHSKNPALKVSAASLSVSRSGWLSTLVAVCLSAVVLF